jgi:signal transduction histidine kinase
LPAYARLGRDERTGWEVAVTVESSATSAAGVAVLDRDGRYLRIDPTAGRLLGIDVEESVGTRSFLAAPDGPEEAWLVEQRPAVVAVPLVCQLAWDEPGSAWRLVMTPVGDSSARRDVRRRFAERALDAVGRYDVDAIVRALVDNISRVCALTGGLIVLIDEQSRRPIFAGGGVGREELAAMEDCRRLGAPMLIWQAFDEGRSVIAHRWADRVRTDPRLAPLRRYFSGDRPFPGSFIAIPLTLRGKRIGVLAGMVSDPASITATEVGLWWDLAEQTALALGYSDAIRVAREAGAERERQRLNEDLHDSVGQDVFALRMLAARTEVEALHAGAPNVTAQSRELRALADTVSSGLRGLIDERRQVRDSLALSEQLALVAREVGRRSGVDIQSNVGAAWDHLSVELRNTIVRIVQEALRNIEKHAHARTASVRVVDDASAPGMLLVEVVDDGESFDPTAVNSATFGLTSIRERAAELGGSVEIRSAPSTTLRVRLRPRFESEWEAAARR